jgi:predicted dehydrogenase
MSESVSVIVVGVGHMGASHARAYHHLEGFDLVGLVAPSPRNRDKLARELGNVAQFETIDQALEKTHPQAVAICSYPDTHVDYTLKCLNFGAHVFLEKPISETVEEAEEIVGLAEKTGKKVVIGYILRHHPAWVKFIEITRTLGKPLVMRMNLNQQSLGERWTTHKQLMKSMSPIVDCGVHYVDVMCQMTRSRPVQVQAIGARLSSEIADDMYNYGNLQVIFEDGSIGWYEAAWGPMISETAFFVKDAVGPQGSVSIVDPNAYKKTDSADIDGHTKTNSLLIHRIKQNSDGKWIADDQLMDTQDEPDHQGLCTREQEYFLKSILEDLDLSEHWQDVINSMRIVLAADESVRTGKIIHL